MACPDGAIPPGAGDRTAFAARCWEYGSVLPGRWRGCSTACRRPGAAATRRYDATGPADVRDRDMAALARAAEALPQTRGRPRDPANLVDLRPEAARADIDLGE